MSSFIRHGFGWLSLMVSIPAAQAHPHAWIDLQSRILLDEQRRIEAVELTWLFDEWYTTVVAEEFPGADAGAMDFLTQIGDRNLKNLKEYSYFTEVTLGGEPVALGEVAEHVTDMVGERLSMRFTVPLTEPVDPKAGKTVLRVFDPTYYIEIVYAEKDAFGFVGDAAAVCAAKLIEPNPSLDAIALAGSLDKTQSGGDDLGKLFAQALEISCS